LSPTGCARTDHDASCTERARQYATRASATAGEQHVDAAEAKTGFDADSIM